MIEATPHIEPDEDLPGLHEQFVEHPRAGLVPPHSNSVAFLCATEFHILVSFVLSVTTYRDRKKILFLWRSKRTLEYVERIEQGSVWDEVVVLDSEKPDGGAERFRQLIPNLERLHFFTWGVPLFVELFTICMAAKIPIILTDEGVGTYSPRERFTAMFETALRNRWILEAPDLGAHLAALAAIWLIEPALYNGVATCPLRRIDLNEFYAAGRAEPELRSKFAFLFQLGESTAIEADVVYFRQYFAEMNQVLPEVDRLVDDRLCSYFDGVNLVVRDHPGFHDSGYRRKGTQLLPQSTPWEALIMWGHLRDAMPTPRMRIYVSCTSSVMFKVAILEGAGHFIFTYRLLGKMAIGNVDAAMDGLVAQLRANLPRASCHVPESWGELAGILSRVGAQTGLGIGEDLAKAARDDEELLVECFRAQAAASAADSESIYSLTREVGQLQERVATLEEQLSSPEALAGSMAQARLRAIESSIGYRALAVGRGIQEAWRYYLSKPWLLPAASARTVKDLFRSGPVALWRRLRAAGHAAVLGNLDETGAGTTSVRGTGSLGGQPSNAPSSRNED